MLADPVSFLTLVLAASTIGLWIATWLLWRTGEKQHEAATRAGIRAGAAARRGIDAANVANALSRDQFTDARRAWVAISDVVLTTPRMLHPLGTGIRVSYTLTNIGLTPATNIFTDIKCIFPGEHFGAEKVISEQKSTIRGFVEMDIQGVIIFPGEKVRRHFLFFVSKSDVEHYATKGTSDGRLYVWYSLVIGVGYKIVGDVKSHLTAFMYQQWGGQVDEAGPFDEVVSSLVADASAVSEAD